MYYHAKEIKKDIELKFKTLNTYRHLLNDHALDVTGVQKFTLK